MKSSNFRIFWIVAVLVLCSCRIYQFRHHNSEPFYSNYSDGDAIRFPLLKPYEAVKADEQVGWTINLPISPYENGIPNYLDIYHPEKVSVKNDVIMVYTTYKPIDILTLGEKVLYWFVLLPDEKKEIGFDSETDFLAFIQKYGIDSPEWQDMDSVFQQFYKTGCLEWIPECN
jgi:hypothetical protein